VVCVSAQIYSIDSTKIFISEGTIVVSKTERSEMKQKTEIGNLYISDGTLVYDSGNNLKANKIFSNSAKNQRENEKLAVKKSIETPKKVSDTHKNTVNQTIAIHSKQERRLLSPMSESGSSTILPNSNFHYKLISGEINLLISHKFIEKESIYRFYQNEFFSKNSLDSASIRPPPILTKVIS